MITISRELVRDGVGTDVLTACLKRHDALLPDMQRLRAYYEGRNPAILERADGERGQTRLPHPFGRYIALTAAGCLTGRPIAYEAPGQEVALEALTRSFHQNAMDSVDAELAVQAAVYGKGVERVYTDRLGRTHSVTVSPEEAFVVYDDTVAHEPLFGLCLSPLSRADGTPEGFQLEVLTGDEILTYRLHDARTVGPEMLVRRERHFFGQPPLIEYWNNCDETGDYAAVLYQISSCNQIFRRHPSRKRRPKEGLHRQRKTGFVGRRARGGARAGRGSGAAAPAGALPLPAGQRGQRPVPDPQPPRGGHGGAAGGH